MAGESRILHTDWDLHDTRHVVFRPAGMDAKTLESGYWRAYRDFYKWGSIWAGTSTKETFRGRMRHVAYADGWKKFEPAWDLAIRAKQVVHALPLLETVLTGFGRHHPQRNATPKEKPEVFDSRAGRRSTGVTGWATRCVGGDQLIRAVCFGIFPAEPQFECMAGRVTEEPASPAAAGSPLYARFRISAGGETARQIEPRARGLVSEAWLL
jgi:hypothetical protein